MLGWQSCVVVGVVLEVAVSLESPSAVSVGVASNKASHEPWPST